VYSEFKESQRDPAENMLASELESHQLLEQSIQSDKAPLPSDSSKKQVKPAIPIKDSFEDEEISRRQLL